MLVYLRIPIILFCLGSVSACQNELKSSPQKSISTVTTKNEFDSYAKYIPTATIINEHSNLYYDSIITIQGKVAYMPVIEVNDEASGKITNIPIIILPNKVSALNAVGVDTTNMDFSPNEYNVDSLQLECNSPAQYDSIIALIDENVSLQGSIFHSENGHHFTNVLFEIQKINYKH